MPKYRVRSDTAVDGIAAATVGSASFVEMLPLSALASLTIEDAVNRTGFSRSRIYDLIASEKLKTFKFGKRRFVDAQSLRDLLAELMAPTDPPTTSVQLGRPVCGFAPSVEESDSACSVQRQSRQVLEDV